jgi:HD-GYP domain-containing protein (c-di-GMP phosphodiesterase class II)
MNLTARQRRDLEFGSLLHDVGKLRVPNEIINKPGKLTDAEWEVIRRHPAEGQAMLERVGGTLAEVGRIVRAHHERIDGNGYPDGLRGDEIPIEARIICACDAYSAMTTNRSYRRAMPAGEALEELRRCAGAQFDAAVVSAIAEVVGATQATFSSPGEETLPPVIKSSTASSTALAWIGRTVPSISSATSCSAGPMITPP